LKPGWWGSLLVQEKYQEGKACDKRQQQQNDNNNSEETDGTLIKLSQRTDN
jgi:hypothetical protein